jgi:subtilisin
MFRRITCAVGVALGVVVASLALAGSAFASPFTPTLASLPFYDSPDRQSNWTQSPLDLNGQSAAGRRAAQRAAAGQTTYDWRTTHAPASDFAPLLATADQAGSVRVSVGLQVLWTVEGRLSKDERDRQRAALSSSTDALLATLSGQSYRLLHRYRTLPFVALDLPSPALRALEQGSRVATIRADRMESPDLAQSVPLIEANETAALGFGGNGEAIAVLDTGVNAQHPFLSGQVVGGCDATLLCPNLDTAQGIAEAGPCDYTPNSGLCQHGTHVAGIAAGKKTTVGGVTLSGVAPKAKIVSFKIASPDPDIAACVSDTTGNGLPFDCPVPRAWDTDVIWALDNVDMSNDLFHFAAANFSFGSPSGGPGPCLDFDYTIAVNDLASLGIAFVASSGNNGAKNMIDYPACVLGAVSVGNTTKADTVKSSSNSSPDLKLLAPGTAITSSWSGPCPQGPGGGFCAESGTSMAAPHVAGAFAVLRQRFPAASVATLLGALQQTGKPVTDVNGQTKPRIRLLTAMVSLAETGFSAGYANVLPGGRIVSDGSGLRLGGGSISITSVPTGWTVSRAYLYVMTVNGADADSSVLLNGMPVKATLIGAARDPCTGGNGSAARVYRADVTSLVAGNGTYSISGVAGTGLGEGASLVIVVQNALGQKRGVQIQQGAWTALPGKTLSHTFPLMNATSVVDGRLNVGIGAARPWEHQGAMTLGSAVAFPSDSFGESDGSWWDDRTAYIKSPTGVSAVNSITSVTDCFTWAYAGLTYVY